MRNNKLLDVVPLALTLVLAFSLIGPSVPVASAEALSSIGVNQLNSPLSSANSPALLAGADDWLQKSPVGGIKPSMRMYHAMAYGGGDQLLLFGGSTGGDETWVYDLSANTWTNQAPASEPSERSYHAMAYIGDDQVLLFGGYDTAEDDETWVYDLSANTWTQKAPVAGVKPSARNGHAMANIGGDQVLLFGGYDGANDDETWVYDLSANTWTKKSPASKPSARRYFAMANIGGDQVLLFGGINGGLNSETWVYDLSANTWTQKSPASKPSGRLDHAMATIGGDQVLLFGGNDGARDDETWLYDLSDNAWTKKSPASKPSARKSHTMATIGSDQVLLFGGQDSSSIKDDTWVYPSCPSEIFCDGFESGDLTAWDSAKTGSGDLKACTKAALSGAYGLCVKNKTRKPKFVKDDGINESSYSAQFNLDPNGLKSKNKKTIRLMQAKDGSANTIWIELRRKTGKYQIRASAGLDGGAKTKTSWYKISNTDHLIEVDWSASTAPGADDGFLKLYIDDVLKQQRSSLDNDTFEVQLIKLGFTNKRSFSVTGIYYLDDFTSTDGGHIGP